MRYVGPPIEVPVNFIISVFLRLLQTGRSLGTTDANISTSPGEMFWQYNAEAGRF